MIKWALIEIGRELAHLGLVDPDLTSDEFGDEDEYVRTYRPAFARKEGEVTIREISNANQKLQLTPGHKHDKVFLYFWDSRDGRLGVWRRGWRLTSLGVRMLPAAYPSHLAWAGNNSVRTSADCESIFSWLGIV